MDILLIVLVAAATFGICFVIDKGFTGLFRNKVQHKTGLTVRLNKHYGGAGVLLAVLGIAAILQGAKDQMLMLVGGIVVLLLGVGFIIYYMSFGVYYDDDSFILSTFGRKSKTYAYRDILGQKLYRVTGGSVLIELYLQDGRSVGLQSTMTGAYPFLDKAFDGWCRQTGKTVEECAFHDTDNSCWFPDMGVE